MQPVHTPRLQLKPLRADDADFLFELHSDPGFRRYIGDRGVHSPADAIGYMEKGPWAAYAEHGFGQMLVTRGDTGERLGTCGLLKRDWLDLPDIGYALLGRHAGHGYASEAATAVLQDAAARLGIAKVAAIVALDNTASIALLTRIGFEAAGTVVPPGETREIGYYLWNAPGCGA